MRRSSSANAGEHGMAWRVRGSYREVPPGAGVGTVLVKCTGRRVEDHVVYVTHVCGKTIQCKCITVHAWGISRPITVLRRRTGGIKGGIGPTMPRALKVYSRGGAMNDDPEQRNASDRSHGGSLGLRNVSDRMQFKDDGDNGVRLHTLQASFKVQGYSGIVYYSAPPVTISRHRTGAELASWQKARFGFRIPEIPDVCLYHWQSQLAND
ncbi:hypothetical protein EDB87DRAFT_1581444 [Lactarius vividus]|nr:hypothetical protein EDB87DRAFT_1581444 [Lactarius vividus]